MRQGVMGFAGAYALPCRIFYLTKFYLSDIMLVCMFPKNAISAIDNGTKAFTAYGLEEGEPPAGDVGAFV